MHKPFLSALVALGMYSLQAQDFHFVQAFNAPVVFNPAATGSQALYRSSVTMLYRGIWDNSLSDQAYQGAALAAETRFCLANQQRNFFALGSVLQHDWSPLGNLSNTHASLTGAFHFHLGSNTYAALGAGLGALNYRVDPARLRFDAQFQNGSFDPSRNNGENFETNSRLQPDFHGGAMIANNTRGYSAGIAWHHLNQPVYAFLNDENRLGIGMTLHGTGRLKLAGRRQHLLLRGLYRRQSLGGNSLQQQALGGALLHIHGEGNTGRHVQVGSYLRGGASSTNPFVLNALVPAVQLGNHVFTMALSYDVNLQRVRSRFSGGMEMSMGFRFGEPDRCVKCPAWGD
jgi:type IX secretion system PorP/SprF family membrane protein